MPLTVSICFLTGRAHLHHWQAHHSDGKVDWPPSPWRLLRALVAVAGRGLSSLPQPLSPTFEDTPGDDLSPSCLATLLAGLSRPPEIWLPLTSGGHTRQFFPIHEGGVVRPSGSAVFDTFAVVSKETPIHFHWPDAPMNDDTFAQLRKLLPRLSYFGRAESWCEARASREPPVVQPGINHWRCVCIEDGGQPVGQEYADYLLERKLAALPLAELKEQAAALLPRSKLVPKGERQQLPGVLAGEAECRLLLRCLLRASGEDMKDGLERPIGSRWVHYAVPRAIYQLPGHRREPVPRPQAVSPPVTLARFALNTATVGRAVLPPLTDTLLFADKFRAAALAWHDYVKPGFPKDQQHPRNLCGREHTGAPVQGHDHAYFWPTDEDNDGFIDHVSVYCPSGFLPAEVEALRRLLRLKQRGGRPDVLVTPVFLGDASSFETGDQQIRSFVSATPYFCPIHLGHGGSSGGRVRSMTAEICKSLQLSAVIRTDSEVRRIAEILFDQTGTLVASNPPGELADDPRFRDALIRSADDPRVPGTLSALWVEHRTRFIRALAFCRRRRHHAVEGNGGMFLIEFTEPRCARPFSIGSQAHFGLGLFVAQRPERPPDSLALAP